MLCALVAFTVGGPSSASADTSSPPPDSVIRPEHPPLQGTRGKVPKLPCGIAGPALDLGDGSHYDSGRGTLRAAMLFVDFSDAPASAYPDASPQEVFNRLVPDAEATIARLSYGRLQLQVTPYLQWVRMPKPLSAYGLDPSNPQSASSHRQFIRDAIETADPSFDFSKFKTVYVMSGPGAERRGGAANYSSGDGVKADGRLIQHAMTLDGYGSGINPSIVVHETGHVMGLPDLYGVFVSSNSFRYTGAWDLMSDAFKTTSMLAWTRRLVGWLDDRNFVCVRKKPTTVKLTPVGTKGGTKGAVLRVGRRRAYVLDAHSKGGDQTCPDAGVLLYSVNGNV